MSPHTSPPTGRQKGPESLFDHLDVILLALFAWLVIVLFGLMVPGYGVVLWIGLTGLVVWSVYLSRNRRH